MVRAPLRWLLGGGLVCAWLLAGCLDVVEAELVEAIDGVPGVTMRAEFATTTIRIEIANNGPEAVRIQWRESAYVDGNGESSRLILYGEAEHDENGAPVDEVVPPAARAVAVAAPAGRIDPASGQGRELLGPPGDEVRLVVSVAHSAGVGYLDYRYRFVERD